MHKKLLVLVATTFATFATIAAPSASAQTVASGAWVRATVPAQKTGGAYLTLRSPDSARVVKGSSPVAETVEIHTMQMHGSVMSMREVPAIELPAGQAVSNFHIMLVGLKRQLKEGETVPVALVVERSGGKREALQIDVAVKPLTYNASAH